MMFTLDREVEYKGVTYRVIEAFQSDTLLVVKKEDYDNEAFPLTCYVIPRM